MAKFIHTADWQLGMTRHFFSEGVQERFAQSRFDSIRTLGDIAIKNNCEFIVVSGDVFESNFVDRKTILRAFEALKSVPVSVYILPGNHDPLDASSVYHSPHFLENKPKNIHVLINSIPIEISNKVEIVGVPWTSKRPIEDLLSTVSSSIDPCIEKIRICVAHGIVDTLSPETDNPSAISLEIAENAINQEKFHYIALGDRHSVTNVGKTNSIWYSGSPEPTDFNEIKSGFALIVEINKKEVTVTDVKIGKWIFTEERSEVYTAEDIERLESILDSTANKDRTVLKLRLIGTLSLKNHTVLEELISRFRETYAVIQINDAELVVIANDTDFQDLELSGFAKNALDRLCELSQKNDSMSSKAHDALKLLVRLWSKS